SASASQRSPDRSPDPTGTIGHLRRTQPAAALTAVPISGCAPIGAIPRRPTPVEAPRRLRAIPELVRIPSPLTLEPRRQARLGLPALWTRRLAAPPGPAVSTARSPEASRRPPGSLARNTAGLGD